MKKTFPALRRSGALLMCAAALALLTLSAGGGGVRAMAGDPALLAAAVRYELGTAAGEEGPLAGLDLWQALPLRESVYLRQGPALPQTPMPTVPPVPTPAATPAPTPVPTGEPPCGEAGDRPPTPENIVAKTLLPRSGAGYVTAGDLYLHNRTDLTVDLAAAVSKPLSFTLPPEGPEVLILHTHTTEAYTPSGTDTYVPSDANCRTLDPSQSVVRVGEEMAEVFEEMGLSVLHDTGLYDYPHYKGAYSRSGAAAAAYLEQYPSLRLVLDVHRDALVGEDGTVYKPVTQVDGTQTAQVMLVIGTGRDHPGWMENLALAARIQKSLNTLYPTLARPMGLRASRYNQELSPGSLLVEVGSHGNTLQEAITAARCFARAAGQVFLSLD